MLAYILLVRILFGLISVSWYVPDETWQSVEISHWLVHGTGYRTWEWEEQIRSAIHPLLFSLPMFLLKAAQIDSQNLIVLLPKLLQGCFTGLSEYTLYNAVKRSEGNQIGSWFILLSSFNWHTLYTASRTLINTAEYSLTNLALSLYIYPNKEPRTSLSFVPVVGLLFMVRPTSALLWAPLCLLRLINVARAKQVLNILFWAAASVLVVCVCLFVDCQFYGSFTITPLNFFFVNVYKNLGVNYGTHPWHWYISNALPSAFGPLLIPFVQGLHDASLFHILPLAINVIFLSCLPHKELRFLQSSFPFLILVMSRQICKYRQFNQRILKYVFVIMNLLLAAYLSLVHQRGVTDAAVWVGRKGNENLRLGNQDNVLFMMPCHSTPLYSHIHTNISTRFLHCEPNLSGLDDYVEEADEFYSDPQHWLNQLDILPTMVVMFDSLQPRVASFLDNYKICATFFHTHFPEGRIGKNVVVHCVKEP